MPGQCAVCGVMQELAGRGWQGRAAEHHGAVPHPTSRLLGLCSLLQHPVHQAQVAPCLIISFCPAENQLLAGFRKRRGKKSQFKVFSQPSILRTRQVQTRKYPEKDLKSMSTAPQGDSLPDSSSSFAFSRTKL